MNTINLKEFGSYSLILIITSNILLYSSALKTAHGDYYIAFEIIRNMNLQSWLDGNIATLMILTAVTIFPLTYFLIHVKIKHMRTRWKMQNNTYLFCLLILTITMLITFSLFTEYILGFHGSLKILLLLTLMSVIFPSGLHSLLKAFKNEDLILKFSSFSLVTILLIVCIFIFKGAALTGESCLVKIESSGMTRKYATIVPIEHSRDVLKEIFLEDYTKPAKGSPSAAYIAARPIDETYSIYPASCDSVNLNISYSKKSYR